MATAVVDSGILIAAANDEDILHREGRQILGGIDRGELPQGLVSNDVVAEVCNYLHGRRTHRLAVDFYDRLS